jgi:phosphatidylserine/phosphatidylglycerophosphate/cardiolipin synthase-like enzyme
MTFAAPVRPLPSPWQDTFVDLVDAASHDLLILSPYVTRRPLEIIATSLARARRADAVAIRLVTDLSPLSLATRALDLGAIHSAFGRLPRASLTHLPSLHAKVYVADHVRAVVTSANLTDGGLLSNYEFGLLLTDPALVRTVREDAEAYAALGGDILREDLADLAGTAETLARLQDQAERGISAALKKALKDQARLAELRLLQARSRGRTTHGIFAETILYLLGHRPQRTEELHRQIQRIHPDLCDDSVDRVIGEMHFGKKWKHYVRTAQQHLKRRGLIAYERGLWYRTGKEGT